MYFGCVPPGGAADAVGTRIAAPTAPSPAINMTLRRFKSAIPAM
jgi:hypothetical protein